MHDEWKPAKDVPEGFKPERLTYEPLINWTAMGQFLTYVVSFIVFFFIAKHAVIFLL